MVHLSSSPIAWLLLRDGHSVPIAGLSPDDLKAARDATVERTGVPLKHTSGLNAIVHCLGFDGDFGDYKDRHWKSVQRVMDEHGLREYRNLFDVEINDLSFNKMKWMRRSLADRLFVGPGPMVRRVFVGYGHDWQKWDRLFGSDSGWNRFDESFIPTDLEQAREWVYSRRNEFHGFVNFFGDQLIDNGAPGRFESATYFPNSMGAEERELSARRDRKVAEVFRWFIEHIEEGWIGIIPVTDRLVLLKGPDGTYDFLWRNLRAAPPPTPETAVNPFGQALIDIPSVLWSERDFETWNYFRQDAWDEKERHVAEVYYYAQGGRGMPYYPSGDVILTNYLRDKGVFDEKASLKKLNRAPRGFRRVKMPDGKTLLLSSMVTVGEFRRFAKETNYTERRKGDSWAAANGGEEDSAPVGATFLDSLAFCAWKERTLGSAVRLFTVDEHRALRPFTDDHYRHMAGGDFPWENYPPRMGLEPSVVWSEPRFLDPGPDRPEFPDANGISQSSRKRWISAENWPPRATWRKPLPWVEYSGLRMVDAWDAYEWCMDGRVAGRYWDGGIGTESWGAYKNSKVGFRLVIEAANP